MRGRSRRKGPLAVRGGPGMQGSRAATNNPTLPPADERVAPAVSARAEMRLPHPAAPGHQDTPAVSHLSCPRLAALPPSTACLSGEGCCWSRGRGPRSPAVQAAPCGGGTGARGRRVGWCREARISKPRPTPIQTSCSPVSSVSLGCPEAGTRDKTVRYLLENTKHMWRGRLVWALSPEKGRGRKGPGRMSLQP